MEETIHSNEVELQKEDAAEPISDEDKIRADIQTLRELFPALKSEDIPEEVWQQVQNGESLSCAYALHFLKDLKEQERIQKHNEETQKKAPPRVRQNAEAENYFSAEAVRAMSPEEVRKHYAAILKSMDSWN